MSDFFRRSVKVTTFRESVPDNPTRFIVSRSGQTTEITSLRVQFHVRRSLTKHPNQCDVRITNLSARTRVDLETKPLLVVLQAGYGDALKLLYTGDLRFGMTKQENADWETLLQLGDGDCMHRWARMNRSYAPGTSVRTVLREAAASMGFELPTHLQDDKSLDQAFDNGFTAHGPTRDILPNVLGAYGYTYSMQNGVLQVLKDTQSSSSTAAPINEEHGMIGTPEFGSPPRSGKPPHMTVNMLLYPELSPGGLVFLTSKVKSGLFRLEVVEHRGDTHGAGENTWTTKVEIKPVEADKPALPVQTPSEEQKKLQDFEELRHKLLRQIGAEPLTDAELQKKFEDTRVRILRQTGAL